MGVDDQVEKIEKECMQDDPEACELLGEDAAEYIVFKHVCILDYQSNYGNTDYKKQCCKYGTNVCQGEVSRKVKKFCLNSKVNVKRMLRLQNKCKAEVDDLTGGVLDA